MNRALRAPTAGGERVQGSPATGARRGPGSPRRALRGLRPRDGAGAARSHLPEPGSPGRPGSFGPARGTPSPGSAPPPRPGAG